MNIIVKKITRNTLMSFIGSGGLLVALLTRIFLGGSHVNIERLNLESEKATYNSNLINVALADVPSEGTGEGTGEGEGSSEGSGAEGSGAEGCGPEGCEGAGGSEGEGEGGE